jgi:hypothetical protein
MTRRSKKPRRESSSDAMLSASAGVSKNSAASLYPRIPPASWQKWCLAGAILLEIIWIVTLLCLVLPA